MIFDKQSERLQPAGARVSSGLPIWPALGIFLLAAACLASGRYYAWSADLLGLLIAISITQTAAVILQKLPFTIHSSGRWFLLAMVAILAMLAAVYLQQIFWPVTQTRHPQWLLPLATAIFILWSVLPEEIDIEAARRAAWALKIEQEKHNTERRILEARLAALQGQIEPHFLYNTLANARALIRQDAEAAETCLQHLIAYLRAAMPDLRANTTTLGQELERAQAYLEIIKIRFGERLHFHVDAAPQTRACLVPPLAVMTLVENAIKHGIEPQVNGGNLTVRAVCEGAQLAVEVIDDGVGFRAEMGGGIGLVNLQERLQALFGPQAELSLNPGVEAGVIARFVVPLNRVATKVETERETPA